MKEEGKEGIPSIRINNGIMRIAYGGPYQDKTHNNHTQATYGTHALRLACVGQAIRPSLARVRKLVKTQKTEKKPVKLPGNPGADC